jgi:hypothetical protein
MGRELHGWDVLRPEFQWISDGGECNWAPGGESGDDGLDECEHVCAAAYRLPDEWRVADCGTYGINLQQGDGNTFTGGDVEGCATALHLGANAQNNTVVGLRNENSTSQVVADTGSSYNSWITGGTMFTGALTDNGTRNSFLDSFHRTFNGMKGDWYQSQQDATVTNHCGWERERGTNADC